MSIPEANDSSFERCPHDKEHPYVVISRDLIRDENISPNCRWIIIYLLSMKDGWKISFQQIREHVKNFIGRDQLYKIIDEAVDAGYMKKEQIMKGNLRRGIKYFVSETPKFNKSPPDLKKILRDPPCEESDQKDALDIPIKDVSPPPLPASSANAPAAWSGIPQRGSGPPSVAGNADEMLKNNFKRSLKDEKEVLRAIKYFNENEELVKSKNNPIGFVIHMVRSGEDLKAEQDSDLIQKRIEWSSRKERTSTGGCWVATREGLAITSGSIYEFHSYASRDSFWEQYGLGYAM